MTEGDIHGPASGGVSFPPFLAVSRILRSVGLPRRGPAEQLARSSTIQLNAAPPALESIPVTCAFPFWDVMF